MEKSMLIINTPKNCEDCRCSAMIHGKLYCPAKDTIVSKGERDCSCPLVAVPDKMPYSESKGIAMASYIEGWNDYRRKLLGKE